MSEIKTVGVDWSAAQSVKLVSGLIDDEQKVIEAFAKHRAEAWKRAILQAAQVAERAGQSPEADAIANAIYSITGEPA